jgi:hypothetical protein
LNPFNGKKGGLAVDGKLDSIPDKSLQAVHVPLTLKGLRYCLDLAGVTIKKRPNEERLVRVPGLGIVTKGSDPEDLGLPPAKCC